MLDKIFKDQFILNIGEQKLKFNSIAEIEFCLDGRTSMLTEKIMEMMDFTPERLKEEILKIKELEKKFESILTKAIEDPSSIDRAMRELKPNTFTQEHKWREIFTAFNEGGEEFNPILRIAFFRYMKYLSSLQQMMTYLYSMKDNLPNEALIETLKVDGIQPESNSESESANNIEDFERMSKGEPVNINLSSAREIDLLLSKHKCKVILDDKLQFVDQEGIYHPLKEKRNTIGRDPSNTVILKNTLNDISRLHLIIENSGDKMLHFIDMSAHGTFIPAKYLKHL